MPELSPPQSDRGPFDSPIHPLWRSRVARWVTLLLALTTAVLLALFARLPGTGAGESVMIVGVLTILLLTGTLPLTWRAGTSTREWAFAFLWGLLVIPAPMIGVAEVWYLGWPAELPEAWKKPAHVTFLAPVLEECAKATLLMGWGAGSDVRLRAHRLVLLALWVGIGFAATETWLDCVLSEEAPSFTVGSRLFVHVQHPLYAAMSAIGVAYGRPLIGVGVAVLLHAASNAVSASGVAPLLLAEPTFSVGLVVFLTTGLAMLALVVATVVRNVWRNPSDERS